MRPRDAQGVICEFQCGYQFASSPVMLELERSVLGSDYGATSWTSRLEADRVAKLLQLDSEARLLDIGAGSGWPALYLARISGCEVTLSDIPLSGLQAARARASTDGLQTRCRVVAADGARLPFADASFDAIRTSDVLCCMPEKQSMLGECRRVARTGARMAFSVIAIAQAVGAPLRQLARESGPTFVECEDYPILLDRSQWRLLEREDLTGDFAVALRARIDGIHARYAAIAGVRGPEWISESLERLQATVSAVEAGLLRREVYYAVALDPGSPLQEPSGF